VSGEGRGRRGKEELPSSFFLLEPMAKRAAGIAGTSSYNSMPTPCRTTSAARRLPCHSSIDHNGTFTRAGLAGTSGIQSLRDLLYTGARPGQAIGRLYENRRRSCGAPGYDDVGSYRQALVKGRPSAALWASLAASRPGTRPDDAAAARPAARLAPTTRAPRHPRDIRRAFTTSCNQTVNTGLPVVAFVTLPPPHHPPKTTKIGVVTDNAGTARSPPPPRITFAVSGDRSAGEANAVTARQAPRALPAVRRDRERCFVRVRWCCALPASGAFLRPAATRVARHTRALGVRARVEYSTVVAHPDHAVDAVLRRLGARWPGLELALARTSASPAASGKLGAPEVKRGWIGACAPRNSLAAAGPATPGMSLLPHRNHALRKRLPSA